MKFGLPTSDSCGIIDLIMLRRSFFATPLAAFQLSAEAPDNRVYAFGDGVRHTPESY